MCLAAVTGCGAEREPRESGPWVHGQTTESGSQNAGDDTAESTGGDLEDESEPSGDTTASDPPEDPLGSTGGEPLPDPPPPGPPDFAEVVWLHQDVSAWPQSVTLDSITFEGSLICLHHDVAAKDPSWPIGSIDDVEVIANPWIFIWHDSTWYGATWEWLRPPGQICKNASSVAGDHIKQAPFDAASGWTPVSGARYYFMVSGLARAGLSNVQARSNLVEVIWP